MQHAKQQRALAAKELSPHDISQEIVGQKISASHWLTARQIQANGEVANELAPEFPNLAELLRMREGNAPPLLFEAFMFFFRREIETDPELARGLNFSWLQQLSADSGAGFDQLNQALNSLAEAGCTFVTMVMENPPQQQELPKHVSYNWDSHAVNCHIFNDARLRLPRYDQAVTALIEDLYQRRLDRRVLLVVTGEFGRTPRLSYNIGTASGVRQPGRDHWPNAMSMIVSGGGMRTGQVIGSTNEKGEHPVQRPLSPNDLWATILRHLGIDQERTFPDHAGRPTSILPYGEAIGELLPVS